MFRYVVMLVLMSFAGIVLAQKAPCPAPEYRLFDFWVGDWDVFSGDKKAGENSIKPILDGCVLQESWSGTTGDKGTSLNFYNPKEKQWNQFWVFSNGTSLPLLQGQFADGKMVLSAVETKDGKKLHQRITWFKNEDGTVRQLWESSDDGSSWKIVFDGLYKKK